MNNFEQQNRKENQEDYSKEEGEIKNLGKDYGNEMNVVKSRERVLINADDLAVELLDTISSVK